MTFLTAVNLTSGNNCTNFDSCHFAASQKIIVLTKLMELVVMGPKCTIDISNGLLDLAIAMVTIILAFLASR